MVSKDNANTGSGGKTTCMKKQKCILNNSQKARQLYRDPELTLEVMSRSHSNPLSHNDVRMKTNPSEMTENGIVKTALNEQTHNIRSVSNLKEMQYLHHEDSLIDASLDKSSLMGFIGSSNLESSEDIQTLPYIRVDVRTEVVLIDEDDDDVSLRERTVTDVSASDGNAADLVCGRLQSISSGSSHSTCQEASEGRGSVTDTPHEAQEPPTKHKRSCCLCVII
ncbi:Paralemmin-2 Precursor [Triplophysa tibetana]|uniref:Paralemmin-2 n=1 Tax=Triplophysa tibetana TaxID=1572043 RepID=A0A5A9P9R9_9TELE|nr:Paralemmin-2 Precursor [Triplophysa tibetana]